MDDLEAFRRKARAWLAANMAKRGELDANDEPEAEAARARLLQRRLYDGGFAGIVFPEEYGGQGLGPEYQRAFTEECAGYEMPLLLNVPTLTILAPTLLDFGTEEQKKRHLPAILRGEELWVQFLSEPTGGSDLAGCITRATRDGDVWILNGSKIWSSGAYLSDYAMCLTRTDWEAPKHRGLTMFILKIHQPGVVVEQIRQINGSMEFCQEFFDDVAIPAGDVVGLVNDGWTVASRLLHHERNAVGGGSPYASGRRVGGNRMAPQVDLVKLARQTGQTGNPHVRQLVAEARALDLVNGQLIGRVTTGLRTGKLPGPAGALMRLFAATTSVRRSDIGLEIAGAGAATWADEHEMPAQFGQQFLFRQATCLGGGSNEMQRNIISERVLGMPREPAPDRDGPFNQARHNRMPTRKG